MRRKMIMAIILIAILGAAWYFGPDLIGLLLQGKPVPQGETDLRFTEISADFAHHSDFDEFLPFMALSAIDIDNDGIDEIFVGGGAGQPDALLRYSDRRLVRLPTSSWFQKMNDEPSYGAASIDVNGDGLVDLFVARASGLYLYENNGHGFTGRKINTPLDETSSPLSIALGDINKDGAVDLYLSNYIRPAYVDGQTIFNREYGAISNLLLNNGDNTFADITSSSGVFEQHNTFTAAFVDLDNDGYSDLVVAQDTGMPRVFRNNGDLTFDNVELPVTYSFPMGIAVSDYNNDGYMDLYFSNVGSTLPDVLLRGDLTREQNLNKNYILLENQGDFIFQDVAKSRNAHNYGFGWGLVSFDFNNDTLADYLITQNYIRFPGVKLLELYSGNLLQQYADGHFSPVEKSALIENRNFGVTTVVSDFNNDGWPDVVIGNLNGKVRVFMNDGGQRNWLKVRLDDSVRSIGARLALTLSDGRTYHNQFYTSEGLGSDQTADLFFGLGDAIRLSELTVRFQDGEVITVSSPEVNTLIDLRDRK